jgi:CheY-like chemotaxis protein
MAVVRRIDHVRSDTDAKLALIVHADATLRTQYCSALRTSGYAVVEAEDGREALAKAFDSHLRPYSKN